jgi:23S rRNA pseudouridine1911/1915/1917 synthase
MSTKPNIKIINVTVKAVFAGSRLDKFLCDQLVEYSRSRIKSLIVDGSVSNGDFEVRDASYCVKSGQNFLITVPAAKPAIPLGQKMNLDIIYEDEDMIIINKPAGLVVHPAAGNPDNTLVNALIAHCGDSLSGIGGEIRPGIVHRLDKDTSGLIVAAKNDITHRGLAKQFAHHTVDRAYKAVVWGVPKFKSGVIKGNIGRNPQNRKKMAIVNHGGKHAITHYRVDRQLGTEGEFWASLIECRLETGRTHQIRVHLTSIGNPIIGDPIYGSKGIKKLENKVSDNFKESARLLEGQALHAFLLGFTHPINGKKILFESVVPSKIEALLE